MEYILIADDNKDITDILEKYVKKEGYGSLIATDGIQTEELFHTYHPAIMGLDIGADDYIVKPFSPSEVMARLRAVLRRISRQSVETQSGQILRVSNMEVNLDEYTFCIDGKKIPMTKKEIETMWTLASTPGKVFTRDNLLDSLWGYDYYGDSRTVDSHIKRLRAKLDSVPHPDWTIKTIWGVGYKLEIAGGQ